MDDFVISGEYPGYTYLGEAHGRFQTDSGEKRDYFNIYVVSPVSTFESDDYHASGFKAEKKKLVSLDAISQGFKPGDRVRLFFDDKQRVVMVALDQ